MKQKTVRWLLFLLFWKFYLFEFENLFFQNECFVGTIVCWCMCAVAHKGNVSLWYSNAPLSQSEIVTITFNHFLWLSNCVILIRRDLSLNIALIHFEWKKKWMDPNPSVAIAIAWFAFDSPWRKKIEMFPESSQSFSRSDLALGQVRDIFASSLGRTLAICNLKYNCF